MGRHKQNIKGKKGRWKNNKKKWEDEACCSAVDKLSLDEGNLLGKRKNLEENPITSLYLRNFLSNI
jgi:hypothetical protein